MKSMNRMLKCGALAAASVGMLAGCGASNVGSKVKPKELTGADALGGKACKDAGTATPLIIDMPDRSFIEAGMQEGVVFVKYDCNQLTVLLDCTLPGKYVYRGLSLSNEFVTLENQDEVGANLLFTGGKGEAKLESGNSLNIGLVSVGRRSTAAQVARSELVGAQCGEATHYVKQAVLGAFAMNTAQKGSVSGSAEVFMAGSASAGSSSAGSRSRGDGDIEACKSAKTSDENPVDKCQSLLRLYLSPVPEALPVAKKGDKDEDKAPAEEEKTTVAEEKACPEGMVFYQGKCATPKADQPTVCAKTDSDDCLKQCDAGNMQSCFNYAELLYANLCNDPSKQAHCDKVVADGAEAMMQADEKKSFEYYRKACEAGLFEACYGFGYNSSDYWEDDEALRGEGMKKLNEACDQGIADACYFAGDALLSGRYGVQKSSFGGLDKYDRACKLGSTAACLELGGFYFSGEHVAKQPQQGYDYLVQFCEQGNSEVCYELGRAMLGLTDYEIDTPVAPVDIENAEQIGRDLLAKGCKKGAYADDNCYELGRVLYVGRDFEQARLYLQQAISSSKNNDYDEAELILGNMNFAGQGGPLNKAAAVDYWIASEDEERLKKAASLLERGKGVIKDTEKAGLALGLVCESSEDKKTCMRVKKLNPEAFTKAMAYHCDEDDYEWACDEHQKMDLEKHKAYLKESCGDTYDEENYHCRRLKSLE